MTGTCHGTNGEADTPEVIGAMNPQRSQYRRTGRILAFLFLSYLPVVGLVGFALIKLSGEIWPVFMLAGLWMAVIVVFTVLRFVAYHRWTGKRPFDWSRGPDDQE